MHKVCDQATVSDMPTFLLKWRVPLFCSLSLGWPEKSLGISLCANPFNPTMLLVRSVTSKESIGELNSQGSTVVKRRECRQRNVDLVKQNVTGHESCRKRPQSTRILNEL